MPAHRLIALTALALAGAVAGADQSFAGTPAPVRDLESSFAVIGTFPTARTRSRRFPAGSSRSTQPGRR
ncbi:MAG: hypothetical protein ACTHJ6_06815 [Oryzihumus sp.]